MPDSILLLRALFCHIPEIRTVRTLYRWKLVGYRIGATMEDMSSSPTASSAPTSLQVTFGTVGKPSRRAEGCTHFNAAAMSAMVIFKSRFSSQLSSIAEARPIAIRATSETYATKSAPTYPGVCNEIERLP